MTILSGLKKRSLKWLAVAFFFKLNTKPMLTF